MISWFVTQASSYAAQVDSLILWIGLIVGAFFLAAEFVLFSFIVKFRARSGVKARYITGEKSSETKWVSYPHYLVLLFDIVIVVAALRVWSDVKIEMPPAEERVRTVVNSAPIILFACDGAGTLTLCEGRGLALLGLRPGEAVARRERDHLHGGRRRHRLPRLHHSEPVRGRLRARSRGSLPQPAVHRRARRHLARLPRCVMASRVSAGFYGRLMPERIIPTFSFFANQPDEPGGRACRTSSEQNSSARTSNGRRGVCAHFTAFRYILLPVFH